MTEQYSFFLLCALDYLDLVKNKGLNPKFFTKKGLLDRLEDIAQDILKSDDRDCYCIAKRSWFNMYEPVRIKIDQERPDCSLLAKNFGLRMDYYLVKAAVNVANSRCNDVLVKAAR